MTSMFEGQPCKGHWGSRRVYIYIWYTDIHYRNRYEYHILQCVARFRLKHQGPFFKKQQSNLPKKPPHHPLFLAQETCLMPVHLDAPVPPSQPLIRMWSALHFATPVATTPTPISLTNFTLTLVQLMVSFVEKIQDVSDDTKKSVGEKKSPMQ